CFSEFYNLISVESDYSAKYSDRFSGKNQCFEKVFPGTNPIFPFSCFGKPNLQKTSHIKRQNHESWQLAWFRASLTDQYEVRQDAV
ncbi:MAG TPA: hypothetical protein PK167_02515, partial [Prolixibacteraceae bacterium]|nr:hypothetical protein [Prolixibacteraceae bacterium]